MVFDATFWVAISFLIFVLVLIYFKIPQKINDLLTNMILDIKKEISESEKLRSESNLLLQKSQDRLSSASVESNKILENAKLTEINFIENNNTFSQEEWDNLYKLSTNTFVEESDELKKSAAGAGLTDND